MLCRRLFKVSVDTVLIDNDFKMITYTKFITGKLQRGGAQYMVMKIYILVGSEGVGKPFWE